MRRDTDLLNIVAAVLYGIYSLFRLIIWKPFTFLLSGLWVLLCDVMKSVYGKIVAGLATLLLIGVGFQFFSSLLN
jgi:hypothetical protein